MYPGNSLCRRLGKKWSDEWGGSIIFNHGKSNSKGVEILLARNMNFEIKQQFSDNSSRLLILDIEIDDKIWTIINC